MPKYFKELYEKYKLKEAGFDFKDVLRSKSKKEKFLAHVRQAIERDSKASDIKVKDVIVASKKSWSVIIFGLLWFT